MKLNEKIFYCRRKAGLSQEALAEELGVSRQAVSKWETGDAVPEISKLLALAKTFDVTTDWLLSEEEPEEKTYNTNYYQETATWGSTVAEGMEESESATSAERFEKAADEWMDRIPGVLGKMVKRFGWLSGVYIALGGAGTVLMGLLTKIMIGGFNKMAEGMMSGFGRTSSNMFGGFGGSTVTFYDESGNALSASESAELANLLGMSGIDSGIGGADGMFGITDTMSGMIQNNPMNIIANILLIGGLIALAGGSILAVIWYKKSKE